MCSCSALSSGCGQEMDQRPADWEYISAALFQPNCATASCHSRAEAAAGLDFSDPGRGYTSLTKLWIWVVDPTAVGGNCRPENGTVVCERGERPLVTPFVPSQSRLVHTLRGQNAPRMPPDRPLTEADIALVEKWILGGAYKESGLLRRLRDGGVDAALAPAPAAAADVQSDSDVATQPSSDAGGAEG